MLPSLMAPSGPRQMNLRLHPPSWNCFAIGSSGSQGLGEERGGHWQRKRAQAGGCAHVRGWWIQLMEPRDSAAAEEASGDALRPGAAGRNIPEAPQHVSNYNG